MSSEKDNILEFNQYMKSDKMSYIIFTDIETLIKKIDGCANSPENSSATKIGSLSIFIADVQCQLDELLIFRKQAYFISWGRLYEKVL